MSVPVNQRTQGKLDVCVKAHDLCCYTLHITRNKNVFDEAYKDPLTDKIVECAIEIHTLVWSANNVLVNKSRKGLIPKEKVDESYAAWRNHASKGNSFHLLQRMDSYYKSLWRE